MKNKALYALLGLQIASDPKNWYSPVSQAQIALGTRDPILVTLCGLFDQFELQSFRKPDLADFAYIRDLAKDDRRIEGRICAWLLAFGLHHVQK